MVIDHISPCHELGIPCRLSALGTSDSLGHFFVKAAESSVAFHIHSRFQIFDCQKE
jgi:hypothetical protein